MPIKLLDKATIARIAAGEVIERPSSVVKELLENSLDAGAKRVDIVIREGGIGYIEVSDDGCGIVFSEVLLAFERHATSKLSSFEDIYAISSLGFRGEALPSIAAVADLEMLTAARTEESGTYLSLSGGEMVKHTRMARSPGTTIKLTRLFSRVPARLKFLKTPQHEASKVSEVVLSYALAYPEVKFTLSIDGRNTLNTPGNGKLRDAVLEIYGNDVASKMLDLETDSYRSSAINISGLVSPPEISRSNRNSLHFFVNRRLIQSRALQKAAEQAYSGLLMVGRYPMGVINIWLDGALVDVNIHPTKAEVKFSDESAVFTAVQRAVRSALVEKPPIPHIAEEASVYRQESARQEPIWGETPKPAGTAQQYFSPVIQSAKTSVLPLLRLVGQIGGLYLLAEGPDGLYIIDQHAAHERIRYEEIASQTPSENARQSLLAPFILELNPVQEAMIEKCKSELDLMGFEIEEFGRRVYRVQSIPAGFTAPQAKALLSELVDNPKDAPAEIKERLQRLMACHTAVRAGQVLNEAEMRELLLKLEKTAVPGHCPHGRPTIVKIDFCQLEKDFKRT
ncbi:DNA mismatch repair protein MutL [Dehalococcoides mccartyi]|uniref:DNA mismatch repair endonuclease MutL n=1 Tax=Dehalococcoides mccartyi TaxID=61435 RepID=UPI00098EF71B|nr:DNA mismatch repair endonuclease MutL [Dehalococcoides mccartyi]AQU03440.1 DNA mismatch repair protein MutL [Dehalococcoides mccartyi]